MAMILRVLIVEGVLAATLFASAGRIDLPWFWAVLAVHSALLTVGMSSIDPDLRRERLKPGPGGRDRYLRLIALPFILAHLTVAGLDVGRFHWSRYATSPIRPRAVAFVGSARTARARCLSRSAPSPCASHQSASRTFAGASDPARAAAAR